MTEKHQKLANDIWKAIAKTDTCKHEWKPYKYKEGTMVCKLCGALAKNRIYGKR